MSTSYPFRVLYEDNHLLVVEKPANIPVQADISGDADLLTLCKRYIKETYHKPGEVYLGLVHRLDRPVGGVMVFARTGKAATRLTAQFQSHVAKKRYAAIVRGKTPAEQTLTDWLLKDDISHSSRVVPQSTPGAKEAKLSYALLAEKNGYSLLDISLYTGRAHQIRVQLSHAGFPLYGDQRYGKESPGVQIRLWAYALTIQHPTLNEEMTFFSAPQIPIGDRGEIGFSDFPAQTEMLPAFSVCRGVYADKQILVADKNAGAEVESELLPALENLFGTVYPVHRLDANTEGLVVFARDEETENALLEAFRLHTAIEKTYWAVLCGVPREKEGELTHSLLKDADDARVRIIPEGTPGALTAKLRYRVIEQRNGLSLVEVDLLTGRTHQIRAQFAAIGCPVLGDDKYGNREMNKAYHRKRQQLLAKRLTVMGMTFESARTLTIPERRKEL